MGKFIKLGIISLVLLFLLLTAMSLLIPSTVRISRAIDINVPSDSILPYVEDLRKWSQWNEMITDTVFRDAEINTTAIRTSDLEIVRTRADKDRILTSWSRGGRKFESGFVIVQTSPESRVVQWYFDIHLRWYPWEKISSIVFDKQLGPPMERSLLRLKNLVEISQ